MEALVRKFMGNPIESTDLVNSPGFIKDMSRIVDLWGYLDDYCYFESGEQADLHSLKSDYVRAMRDISEATKNYEKTENISA